MKWQQYFCTFCLSVIKILFKMYLNFPGSNPQINLTLNDWLSPDKIRQLKQGRASINNLKSQKTWYQHDTNRYLCSKSHPHYSACRSKQMLKTSGESYLNETFHILQGRPSLAERMIQMKPQPEPEAASTIHHGWVGRKKKYTTHSPSQ